MRSMTVFNYLLESTLAGSVLILLTVTVRGLFRNRLGSRAVSFCWLAVALRLLLPISLPNPLMDGLRPDASVDMGARPLADQVRQRVIDAGYHLSSEAGLSAPVRRLARGVRAGETGRWILLVWLAVAVGAAAWLLYRKARFARNARRNRVRPLDDAEQALYLSLCERYGVKRPVPVYYTDRITGGCIAGVMRPFIGLPMDLPGAHLSLQLSHQLCHLRAHDPFWGVVRALCCGLHWFNPLVWIAAWLSYRDSEMACDDRVTAKLHDMDRLAYANVIVSAGQRESGVSAGASFTDQHLRQRVTAVIRCVKGSRVAIAVGSLAAACVLMLSFATGESEPLPAIEDVPAVTWTAGAQPIARDMDAIAAARRFLESPFVGEDTAHCSFTAYRADGLWRVEARLGGIGEPIVLVFSADGGLTRFEGLALLGDLTFEDHTYTHRKLTQSIRAYLDAFVSAEVPDLSYDTCSALSDMRSGDVRLLVGFFGQNGVETAEFAIQVEPVACVLALDRDP